MVPFWQLFARKEFWDTDGAVNESLLRATAPWFSWLLEALLLASLDGVCFWKNYCAGIESAPTGHQFSLAPQTILVLYGRFVKKIARNEMLCWGFGNGHGSERKRPAGPGRQVWANGKGERRRDPPSSSLTLIRFARLMSSAVMVLCVGTALSSCCGWICSGWFSDCCSSADCVSDGTGVCSCCSSPFSVACPVSSNCPLLEKCSKSWNRKSYNQWLFPPPTEKCFDNTQQTTRFLLYT